MKKTLLLMTLLLGLLTIYGCNKKENIVMHYYSYNYNLNDTKNFKTEKVISSQTLIKLLEDYQFTGKEEVIERYDNQYFIDQFIVITVARGDGSNPVFSMDDVTIKEDCLTIDLTVDKLNGNATYFETFIIIELKNKPSYSNADRISFNFYLKSGWSTAQVFTGRTNYLDYTKITLDNVEYLINDNNQAYLYGFKETDERNYLEIPHEVNGYPVVEIYEYAFVWSSGSFSKVSIPSTIKKIGKGAFYNVNSLAEVYFDVNCQLQTIEPATFGYCSNLVNINLPNTITEISSSAFIECSKLLLPTLPLNLKIIGPSAFVGCNSLVEIIIPNSVETIGTTAFMSCLNLEVFYVGSNVKVIEAWVFMLDDSSKLKVFINFVKKPKEWSEQWYYITDLSDGRDNIFWKNDWQYDQNGKLVVIT